MTHTIALPNTNKFEFLASILATWDESEMGILNKRAALDQLLIRTEIDGYEKSRVDGNRDLLMWQKQGSDLVVYVARVGDGVYDVLVHTHNTRVRAIGIEEL